jgi:hypothetical protein
LLEYGRSDVRAVKGPNQLSDGRFARDRGVEDVQGRLIEAIDVQMVIFEPGHGTKRAPPVHDMVEPSMRDDARSARRYLCQNAQ